MGAEADIIAYLTSRHLWSVADGAGFDHSPVLMAFLVATRADSWALGYRAPRTTVHGRPHFAKLSVHEGLQDRIAPVHSDFCCGLRRCP
jgi:hypothetical protein